MTRQTRDITAAGVLIPAPWVLGVVAIHNWQLARFDDRAQQDVWGEDDTTLSEAQNKAMAEPCTEKNIESFHQDVAIWNNKCVIDNPLMCDGDGPIHLVRKWYSQFMTDINDVREDQVRPREYVTMQGPSVADVIAAMG